MAVISVREAAAAGGSRDFSGPALFSAGFRPFFLLAAIWAAIAVPAWLAAYVHGYDLRGALPAMVWHAHEMVFGYGLAAVAGFLLTAIPNWTGRLPIRGAPLAALAALWLAGRVALLASGAIGPGAAAALDLAFPVVLIALIARELIAGRNWRNLPMVAALSVILAANVLVHLQALGIAFTASLGNRLGIATLLALIAFVGGRIVPSFTRNWLAKERPGTRAPAQADAIDMACLAVTLAGLAAWVIAQDAALACGLEILAGGAAAVRLSRWRGLATTGEPLLFILHVGYGWLVAGLLLAGVNGLTGWMPPGAPLHALTVGAIGSMTIAVMTRATLGHAGRPLAAGRGTAAIYILVTLAALLRLLAPLSGTQLIVLISLAGCAWSAAFALFAILYGPILIGPRKI
jgi:uncharacterized protein involved in response to NO